MKCLVTGGAGFIGSHLADLLVDLDYEVVVIDYLSVGRKEYICHLFVPSNISNLGLFTCLCFILRNVSVFLSTDPIYTPPPARWLSILIISASSTPSVQAGV